MDLVVCLDLVNEVMEEPEGRPVAEPTHDEVEALLDFTRSIAHATERKSAPVAAYALGLAIGGLGPARRAALMTAAAMRIDEVAAAETRET